MKQSAEPAFEGTWYMEIEGADPELGIGLRIQKVKSAEYDLLMFRADGNPIEDNSVSGIYLYDSDNEQLQKQDPAALNSRGYAFRIAEDGRLYKPADNGKTMFFVRSSSEK